MNRYQRVVLIAAGVVVGLVQLYGISEYGLDDSRGWAVSFVIAAALLFVGLGSGNQFWRQAANVTPTAQRSSQAHQHTQTPQGPAQGLGQRAQRAERSPSPAKRDEYAYGRHISELDLAIAGAKRYAETTGMCHPLQGNGKSLHWNVCAMIYASMLLAARKTQMTIPVIVWNTIIRGVAIRMVNDGIDGTSLTKSDLKELEEEAHEQLKVIDNAVEDCIQQKGAYLLQPAVQTLALMFGARGEGVKALSVGVAIYADTAHKKIIPELLEDLS